MQSFGPGEDRMAEYGRSGRPSIAERGYLRREVVGDVSRRRHLMAGSKSTERALNHRSQATCLSP